MFKKLGALMAGVRERVANMRDRMPWKKEARPDAPGDVLSAWEALTARVTGAPWWEGRRTVKRPSREVTPRWAGTVRDPRVAKLWRPRAGKQFPSMGPVCQPCGSAMKRLRRRAPDGTKRRVAVCRRCEVSA